MIQAQLNMEATTTTMILAQHKMVPLLREMTLLCCLKKKSVEAEDFPSREDNDSDSTQDNIPSPEDDSSVLSEDIEVKADARGNGAEESEDAKENNKADARGNGANGLENAKENSAANGQRLLRSSFQVNRSVATLIVARRLTHLNMGRPGAKRACPFI